MSSRSSQYIDTDSGKVVKSKKQHDLVKYIYNEWKLTRAKWAFYPRSYIPLLIQIATTNLVESWHNSLKKPSQTAKKTQAVFSPWLCDIN
jgi:hypothetical protein